RVSLSADDVASELFTATCSCPAASKGTLCKHIWATLLTVEDKRPDFFDGKQEIEKKSPAHDEESPAPAKFSKPFIKPPPKPLTEAQIQSKEAYKAKQNDYRKQQYQKQKQRLKDIKQDKKKSKNALPAPTLPEDVERAMAYFSDNGFPLENPPRSETVQLAKKKLSRIFHPDIGGSHDEILELNKHCETIFDFIEAQS
ncbi:MAG: SWIM zinc finger family protein, partial [Pseudobdellovibrionaceae bacterium]